MGDQCTTIAKLTKLSADLPPDTALLEGFREMGERAEEMTRVAMQSLADRDVDAAESLMDLDELIDRSQQACRQPRPRARRDRISSGVFG